MANGNDDRRPGKASITDEHLLGQARLLHKWGLHWALPARAYPMLRSITIYPPKYSGADWMVVLRSYTEDGACVAFHKKSTMLGAISGALHRHFSNGLSYKPDKYAQG